MKLHAIKTLDNPPVLQKRLSQQDVIAFNGKVFRASYSDSETESILESYSLKKLFTQKNLSSFRILRGTEKKYLMGIFAPFLRTADATKVRLLEQKPLEHSASPAQWTSSMWVEAARLVLQISSELLADGLELAEINPEDIGFRHTKPIFINPSIIEPFDMTQYAWKHHAEFRRRFINPLVRFIRLDIPFDQSLMYENGVEPESLLQEAGWLRSLSPGLFSSAFLPSILNQQVKKRGFFSFYKTPEINEVVEYRKNFFASLLKEVNKIQDTNLLKKHTKPKEPLASITTSESWIKEKINLFHPRSILEFHSADLTFSKYASEIGIDFISHQPDEKVCDRIFRESNRLKIRNLCCNEKNLSRFAPAEMILMSRSSIEKALTQFHFEDELIQYLSKSVSKYLILDIPSADPLHQKLEKFGFVFSDGFSTFSLFIKVDVQTRFV